MEERCTREVSDQDAAIEVLKAKNERLEGEKGGLANSLAALRLSLVEKEQEKEALRADLAKARDVEALFAKQARRANELAEGLRRELASEKESAATVGEQLSLTMRRLDLVRGSLLQPLAITGPSSPSSEAKPPLLQRKKASTPSPPG